MVVSARKIHRANRLLREMINSAGREIKEIAESSEGIGRPLLSAWVNNHSRFNPLKAKHAEMLGQIAAVIPLSPDQVRNLMDAAREDSMEEGLEDRSLMVTLPGGMHVADMLLDVLEDPISSSARKKRPDRCWKAGSKIIFGLKTNKFSPFFTLS